jgi:Rieske Fe-S protein
MLIGDLILNRKNPWEEVYQPNRFVPGALGNFARENLNVAVQYTDWITPGEVNSVDEIKPGHGALMRHGLTKIAVYRNQQGQLTKLSAVCPHLKCLVHWNRAEETWDCPCHGSRFSPEGQVLNGPANSDLAKIE